MRLESANNYQAYSSSEEDYEEEEESIDEYRPSPIEAVVRIRPLLKNEDGNGSSILSLSNMGSNRNVWGEGGFHKTAPHTEISSSPTPFSKKYETVLQLEENGGSSQTLTFDNVFPSSSNQTEVYSTCITPLVRSCLEGYNATVLTHGQKGSGKTYTMMGDYPEREGEDSVEMEDESGLVSRALNEIFRLLKCKAELQPMQFSQSDDPALQQLTLLSSSSSEPTFEYQVHLQFLEIYCEQIHDLLTPEIDGYWSEEESNFSDSPSNQKKALSPREQQQSRVISSPRINYDTKNKKRIFIRDGKEGEDCEVIGASQVQVQSVEEALKLFRLGLSRRHTKKTSMNTTTSRSHTVFTLMIQQAHKDSNNVHVFDDRSKPKTESVEIITSKMHFVDLAGSTRISPKIKRRHEVVSINKGLLALNNVISALGNGNVTKPTETKYVSYRDSKLTRLLRGSLGGNHKTLMIACVSPSNFDNDGSLNILRCANRAKNIVNHIKVNTEVHEIDLFDASLCEQNIDDDNNNLIDMTDNNRRKSQRSSSQTKEVRKTRMQAEVLATNQTYSQNRTDDWFLIAEEEEEEEEEGEEEEEEEEKKENYNRNLQNKAMDKFEQSISRDFTLAVVREIWMSITHDEDKNNLGNEKESQEMSKDYCMDWTINELYDYLLSVPSPVSTEMKKDEFDFFENVPASNSRIAAKFEKSIYQRQSLAKSITGCQEIYLALKLESAKRLLSIERKLDNYAQEKEHLHSIVDLLEEGLVYSQEMEKSIAAKEEEIAKLMKERGDVSIRCQVEEALEDEISKIDVRDIKGGENDGTQSIRSDQSMESELGEVSESLSSIKERTQTKSMDEQVERLREIDTAALDRLVAELAFQRFFSKGSVSPHDSSQSSSQTKSSTCQATDDNEIKYHASTQAH